MNFNQISFLPQIDFPFRFVPSWLTASIAGLGVRARGAVRRGVKIK